MSLVLGLGCLLFPGFDLICFGFGFAADACLRFVSFGVVGRLLGFAYLGGLGFTLGLYFGGFACCF